MSYWDKKFAEEGGRFKNDHYEFLYTGHWGLEKSFYDNKKILDIGPGPRGSLEWATNAAEAIGIDSLSETYKKFGTDQHRMKYVNAGMEDAPFPDAHFDVVASVNSLDHVADLDKTIAQIKRVTKPGGFFLLLVELNHPPTVCEPITLNWDVLQKFEPEFALIRVRHYEFDHAKTMTQTITGPELDPADRSDRVVMLSALMRCKPFSDLGELSELHGTMQTQWFKPHPEEPKPSLN